MVGRTVGVQIWALYYEYAQFFDNWFKIEVYVVMICLWKQINQRELKWTASRLVIKPYFTRKKSISLTAFFAILFSFYWFRVLL
jgi:hypothetical protein